MYDEEHPLEIALAAFVAGLAFAIFLYAKLGVFNPNRKLPTEIFNTLPEQHPASFYELDTDENTPKVLQ